MFSNYNLIGSLWLLPNTLQPNFDNLQPNGVGSVDLANSVLETYAQGVGTSYFSCHTTGKGDNYPGKDITQPHAAGRPRRDELAAPPGALRRSCVATSRSARGSKSCAVAPM